MEEEVGGRLPWPFPRFKTPLPGPKAQAIIDRDAVCVSSSYTCAYPLVTAKGEGSVIEDVDGNRFLDCAAGIAVATTGHSHPDVVRAVVEQAGRYLHVAVADFYAEGVVRLAEALAPILPIDGGVRCFFSNSGTEAVEAALKLARYSHQAAVSHRVPRRLSRPNDGVAGDDGEPGQSAAVGAHLLAGLRRLAERHPLIGDVRGRGLMIGIELVRDRQTKERADTERDALVMAAFRRGLLTLGAGRNVVRLSPPLVLTQTEADTALELLDEAFTEVEVGTAPLTEAPSSQSLVHGQRFAPCPPMPGTLSSPALGKPGRISLVVRSGAAGTKILDRRYRTRAGELDIIAPRERHPSVC